jgi:threonine dehydrogenase-like Zn-dependent dehydrogenase
MSMLALCRTDAGVRLERVPLPVRQPGEALIRVRMAGICNTDLELARGYMNFSGVLGHEFVGEVIETDAEAANWRGQRVAGEINLACGKCPLCARGLNRHCGARSVLGILGKDGCFAQYVTLPLVNLHRVPETLSDAAASFIEPIAACYEILEQLRLDARDRILILGDGKLAQLIARVLTAHGLAPLLSGKHAAKLERATRAGLPVANAQAHEPKSYDVVIEATGSPSGMQRAIELVRPRGTIVLKSTYHGPLQLDAAPLVIDELTVIGSRCGPFEPAIGALAAHKLDPTPLIDATLPLAQAEAALRKAAEPGVLKVLLRME